MGAMDEPVRVALHDDAYLYAFRRSRSARLAVDVAVDAVEAVEAVAPRATPAAVRILLVTEARASLQRFLPPSLPPRVEGNRDLQAALAALSPGEREFLLLRHWDGLDTEAAARASGQDPGRLTAVEAMCGHLSAGPGQAALAAVLTAADPARSVTEDDLGRSRRALRALPDAPAASGADPPDGTFDHISEGPPPNAPPNARAPSGAEPPDSPSTPAPVPARTITGTPADDVGAAPNRRARTIIGSTCLLLIAAVVAAFLARQAIGPASGTAHLFESADVVAVVAAAEIRASVIDGEVRILRNASVVQTLKGESAERVLTVDVTGRSTLERPYSRTFYPPNQLMFLVHGEHGVLTPIEGEGSVLTLVNRRAPEAATPAGEPVPLPEDLRNTIRAMPPGELVLDTSGEPPGALDPAVVVGVRPDRDRDASDQPENLQGTFRMGVKGTRACVMFTYDGRLVLLRWPEGFSAYEREQVGTSTDGDPPVRHRILTVLNERGYPYVDDDRSTPFIRGVPTGGRGECGGQELEVWDIAVDPGSTLLFY